MTKLLTAMFFVPLFLCANLNQRFLEIFSEKISVCDIPGCYKTLEMWEKNDPTMLPTLQGLRASIALMEGDLLKSSTLMEQSLKNSGDFFLPSETAQYIRKVYAELWSFSDIGNDLISYRGSGAYIQLCKVDQPKGLKFSYWIGVAQILAACVIAPFNLAIAGTLALNGANMAIQAGAEAHKNMEQWEREQGAQARREEELFKEP